MKSFRKVFVTLCLIMAGASSWAADTFEYDQLVFLKIYNLGEPTDLVYVIGYTGTAVTVEIPAYVWGYKVLGLSLYNGTIQMPTVKTLIFEGPIKFSGSERNPTLYCPILENVYFKGASPSLPDPFAYYFGQRQGIVAHVGDKTPDEIAEMKGGSDGWHGFTDIVSYNEAQEETVKVYVTVEEDSPAHSAMFEINSSEYIYGHGSKVYTKNKHADLTFFVADGTYGTTKNVYVNGKDVIQDMEADPDDSPFYSAENVKKYTLENLKTDVYIRITAQDKDDEFTLSVGRGGKVTFEKNGTNTIQNNNTMYFRVDKGQHMPLTVIPDEGYELDFFWWDGVFITSNVGSQITIEPQGDGTYIYNVSGGGKFFVAFKPVGSSGSSLSTYDLNGDGFIDVSDIDKLIEEINNQ